MSTLLRKQGGKLRKTDAEEPSSKRSKTDTSGKEGELKKNHRKKNYHTGPIVAELRSMDRKLRSQDKKPKMEEEGPQHLKKTPAKHHPKRKKAAPKEEEEEEEELEIEILETKRIRGKDKALVHFLGYAHSEDEWMPLSEIHTEETDSEAPSEKKSKKRKAGKEDFEHAKRPKGKASKGKRKVEEVEEKEDVKPKRPGRPRKNL